MEPLLNISGISKKYPGNKNFAVNDFSITVNSGEVIALLGESGCGKTTVLRMIAGFEVPDSGSIMIDGKMISGQNIFIEPEKRGVGIVFQDYGLFPNQTVEQNIAFGLFRFNRQARQEIIADVLALCGLEDYARRFPHQLSGGQKQRVALARALAPRPKVLLFDEPFSNIDTLRKARMRADIGNILRQTGTTAIFVTHDTRDVLTLADRVAIINQGVCQQIGTPATVYRDPVNSYVARFFGKTNLMEGSPVPGGFQTAMGMVCSFKQRTNAKSNVLLSIRPEDLELCSPDHAGCFRGKVVNDQYMGNAREITVQIRTQAGCNPEVLLYVSKELELDGEYCCFRQKNGCEPGILEN